MKLIKASYEIITKIDGERMLKDVEIAARTCYKSEDKIEYSSLNIPQDIGNDDGYAKSARVILPKLISKGHHAMLEFGGMVHVKFICDRGVSHELVRHRLCSFAQESTRYCNYGNAEHITFILPCWFSEQETALALEYANSDNNTELDIPDDAKVGVWLISMSDSEDRYNFLVGQGWQPQQARSVLPNSLKTEINMSGNVREWRHIFEQRCSSAAHPQMRELMIPLLEDFKKQIPVLFDDITF